MAVMEKPPLQAVYFAHAGVKGMKWGRRKARPTGGGRPVTGFRNKVKAGAGKASTMRKVGIGVAAIGTVLVANRLLASRGMRLKGAAKIALGAGAAAAFLAREANRPVRKKK